MNPKRLLDMAFPVADEHLQSLTTCNQKDDAHSCEWKRFLPVLYRGFRLHLHAVIDLSVGLIQKIAKQHLVDAMKGDQTSVPGNEAICEGHVNEHMISKPACEECHFDWLKTAHALDNHVSTATKRLNVNTLKILKHYGFVATHYTPDNTSCFAADCIQGFYVKARIFYDERELCSALDFIVSEMGYDVNNTDEKGNSLLHFLMINKRYNGAVLSHLLSKGASVNERNKEGNTPLNLIPEEVTRTNPIDLSHIYNVPKHMDNILEKLDVLLCHGADMNAVDSKGKTPFLSALESCSEGMMGYQIGVIKLLVRHGCEVNNDKIKKEMVEIMENYGYIAYVVEFFNILYHAGFKYGFKFSCPASDIPYHLKTSCSCKKCKDIKLYQTTMPSLTDICRSKVRSKLKTANPGRSVQRSITSLEIPEILKGYLKMDPKTEVVPWAIGVKWPPMEHN